MKVENIDNLIAKLRDRVARSVKDDDCSVLVGYTAAHAIYVHEMVGMKHAGVDRPSGLGQFWGPSFTGPKFLEGPARELSPQLAAIVVQAKRQGKTTAQALILAGLRLQRESQLRVPVEHGVLKNSAFTRLEAR